MSSVCLCDSMRIARNGSHTYWARILHPHSVAVKGGGNSATRETLRKKRTRGAAGERPDTTSDEELGEPNWARTIRGSTLLDR